MKMIILLVMVLGFYPVFELTRIIVVDGMRIYPDKLPQFIFEIVFMWVFYLGIIPLLYHALPRFKS